MIRRGLGQVHFIESLGRGEEVGPMVLEPSVKTVENGPDLNFRTLSKGPVTGIRK